MAGVFPSNPVAREGIILALTAFFTLVFFPIAVITGVLFYLIRAVLNYYKMFFRPDLGEFLSRMNAVMAAYDPYSEKDSSWNLVNYMTLDGHMTVEEMADWWENSIKKFRQQGVYPELSQRLTQWMGFSIWAEIPDFNPRDYVRYLDKDLYPAEGYITDDNVAQVAHNYLRQPFKKDGACYEWVLCHDTKYVGREGKPTTLYLCKFHHALGDGLSMTQMFAHTAGDTNYAETFIRQIDKAEKGTKVRRSLLHQLWYVLTFPALGAYEFSEALARHWDANVFMQFPLTKYQRDEYHYRHVLRMSKNEMNQIRKARGNAKVFSVIHAALGAGLRRVMVKHDMPVPDDISICSPMPIPGPGVARLSNDMTSIVFTLPIGLNNRQAIIDSLDRQAIEIRTSRFPLVATLMYSWMGILPRKFKIPFVFTTILTSNFPGPEKAFVYNGHEMLTAQAIVDMDGSMGFYFWCGGYCGNFQICLGVSKDAVPDRAIAEEIWDAVAEEFKILRNTDENIIVKA